MYSLMNRLCSELTLAYTEKINLKLKSPEHISIYIFVFKSITDFSLSTSSSRLKHFLVSFEIFAFNSIRKGRSGGLGHVLCARNLNLLKIC